LSHAYDCFGADAAARRGANGVDPIQMRSYLPVNPEVVNYETAKPALVSQMFLVLARSSPTYPV